MINEHDIKDMWPELKEMKANYMVQNRSRAGTYMVGGSHYKDMKVEPWDVADTWPVEQQIGVYRHGAMKYIMRMGHKDKDVQELRKAIHYLEKLIEVLESNGQS